MSPMSPPPPGSGPVRPVGMRLEAARRDASSPSPSSFAPSLFSDAPRPPLGDRARDLYQRVMGPSRRAVRPDSGSTHSSFGSAPRSDASAPTPQPPALGPVSPALREPLMRSRTEPSGSSFARWGQSPWEVEVALPPAFDPQAEDYDALMEQARVLVRQAELLRERQHALRQQQYALGLKVSAYKARFVSPREPLIDAELQRSWDRINRAIMPGAHAADAPLAPDQDIIFLGQMRSRVASLREEQSQVEALCREALIQSPCDEATLQALVAEHKDRLRCQRHVLQLYLKLADLMHDQAFCHGRLLEVQRRHRDLVAVLRRLSERARGAQSGRQAR